MNKTKTIFFCFICFFSICNSLISNENYVQKEIELLQKEIEDADNDSLVVRKLVDLSVLYPDGSKSQLKYMKEGLDLAKRLNMEPEMGIFYSDFGWYYFYQNDRENTIKYFELAVKYCEDIELLVYAYGILSNTYSWSGKHDQAKEYAEKCLHTAETAPMDDESERQKLIADAYMFVGDVYRYQDEKGSSKYYYAKALTYLDYGNNYASVLRIMTNIYLGDASSIAPYSYFNYVRWIKLTYESVPPRKKHLIVYNLIKAAETSVLTAEKEEIKTLELENQRKIIISTIIISILLVIIALLLIHQVYIKRKTNKKLEKANEIKSRLFIILNHDLKQPIASLISYLDLKASNPDIISKEEEKMLDQKTSKAANQLYTDMENLLLWAKNQMESFEPDFKHISINKLFDDIKTFFSYEERVKIEYEIEEDLFLKTDENYLKTIVRNFTQNAINASLNIDRPIVWKARKEKQNVVLSIENQGKKIENQYIDLLLSEDENKVSKRGAGLIIIRNLAKSIHCKIKVETGEEYGTKFILTFK